MDANKDDAIKCLNIAKNSIKSGDRSRALKFLNKARRLDPSIPIDESLSKLLQPEDKNTNEKPFNPVPESSSSGEMKRKREQVEVIREIERKKDYYEILGLENNSSAEDIRKAYKKLSLKVHPDKNPAPGAEDSFKKLLQAFQCLSNDESRRKYDLLTSLANKRVRVSQTARPVPTSSGSVPTRSGVPTSSGSVPTSRGPVPRSSGSVPTSSGSVPTSRGPVPRSSGVPPSSGSVPTSRGPVPRSSGSVPTSNGVPRSSGSVPTSSGVFPTSSGVFFRSGMGDTVIIVAFGVNSVPLVFQQPSWTMKMFMKTLRETATEVFCIGRIYTFDLTRSFRLKYQYQGRTILLPKEDDPEADNELRTCINRLKSFRLPSPLMGNINLPLCMSAEFM